jgi:hypothetical protein
MATYDIHFQPNLEEEQRYVNERKFTFGYVSAVGVKGPQKLINRWLKCLFTVKGTDLLNRSYGTGFGELIGSNTSRRQDLIDALALYINDCNEQIKALDLAQFPPDDERLASATLTSVVQQDLDKYDVYITIKNIAGTVLVVEIPTKT